MNTAVTTLEEAMVTVIALALRKRTSIKMHPAVTEMEVRKEIMGSMARAAVMIRLLKRRVVKAEAFLRASLEVGQGQKQGSNLAEWPMTVVECNPWSTTTCNVGGSTANSTQEEFCKRCVHIKTGFICNIS